MAATTNKYGAPRRVHHNYEGNFLFRQKRLLDVECGNPEGEIEDDEVITYKILKTELGKLVSDNGETVMGKSVDVKNNSHNSIEEQQIKNLTEKFNQLETSLETNFIKKQELMGIRNTLENYVKKEDFDNVINKLRKDLCVTLDDNARPPTKEESLLQITPKITRTCINDDDV